MQKLTLYTYFRSSTAHRVRIAMNLKQINYEPKFINLKDGEQKSLEYAKVNPNAAVPALVLPDGNILIESVAIIEFLDETHPDHKLLPTDPVLKAQVRGFCEVINSGIHPYHNLRLFEWVDTVAPGFDRVAFAHNMLEKEFKALDALLEKSHKKYCFGDDITMADLFLVPQVQGAVARFKIDLEQFPHIKEVYNNLKDIPEFYKAQPDQQPDYQ